MENGNRKDKFKLPKVIILLLFVGYFILYSNYSPADVIHLKNGRKMKGEIQRQDDKKVYLQIRMGVIGVARDEIEKIEKTPAQIQKTPKEIKDLQRGLTPEEKKRQELPKIKISNRRIYKDGKLFFIKGIAYSVN